MKRGGSEELIATPVLLPTEVEVWKGKADSTGIRFVLMESLFCLMAGTGLFLAAIGLWNHMSESIRKTGTPQGQAALESRVDTKEDTSATRGEMGGGRASEEGVDTLLFSAFLLCGGAAFFSCFLSAALFFEAMRLKRAFYLITSERICIQSGWLNKTIYTMDLDKVVSLKLSSSWLERRWSLCSIEFFHAGGVACGQRNPWYLRNPYSVTFVPARENVLSRLALKWLPRDNSN